jgi:hypothetical protein
VAALNVVVMVTGLAIECGQEDRGGLLGSCAVLGEGKRDARGKIR